MKRLIISAMIALLLGIEGANGGIVNGSFETGDFTGWFTSGSSYVNGEWYPGARVSRGGTDGERNANLFAAASRFYSGTAQMEQIFSANAGSVLSFDSSYGFLVFDTMEAESVCSMQLNQTEPVNRNIAYWRYPPNIQPADYEWQSHSATIPQEGTYELRFAVETQIHPDPWTGQLVGTADTTLLVDNVRLAPPLQRVHLAWGEDVPGTWRELGAFNVKIPLWSENGSTPAVSVTTDFKNDVRQAVERIFRDSGITNIAITNTPVDGAASVYFSSEYIEVGIDPLKKSYLGGHAFLGGGDRFNRDPEGKAAVFVHLLDVEAVAETTAHEIGHLLGLRHVAPDLPEIMEQGHSQRNERELFQNMKSDITDFSILDVLNPDDHNPRYYLERYIDGDSHESLLIRGMKPGNWDLPGGRAGSITTTMNFDIAPATVLHDVTLVAVSPDGSSNLLGQFDSLTISDLEAMSFDLLRGETLNLFASSTEGVANDVMLAAGDPTDPSNAGVNADEGVFSAFLQQEALDDPSGYQTLGSASVTGEPVPEPSSIILASLGALSLVGIGRRRKGHLR